MRTACCYELFVSVESLALLWLGWCNCFACILQFGNIECSMYDVAGGAPVGCLPAYKYALRGSGHDTTQV